MFIGKSGHYAYEDEEESSSSKNLQILIKLKQSW